MAEVSILGCGPAGLLAAHAVTIAGHAPIIYSKKVKSKIGGAQFLHTPIPGIAGQPDASTCVFTMKGDPAVYAEKVYGNPDAPTSWADYPPGEHLIFNMREAYDKLWDLYQGNIWDTDLTSEVLRGMLDVSRKHIISTIPAPSICPDPENWEWESQKVWITYGEDINVKARNMEIIYSGDKDDPWYRCSNLFGWRGIEYGFPGVPGSHLIEKPLRTNWPGIERVHQLGRYGRFEKKVLIHDAFFGTLDLIRQGMVG